MAKISVTKLFEFALVAASKSAQEIKPFIDDCNQKFEQIIRAFTELTLKDNLKGSEITLNLKHGIASVTNIQGRSIYGVMPMRVVTDAGTAEALSSLSWYLDPSTRLVVLPEFKTASTEARTVILYVLFN